MNLVQIIRKISQQKICPRYYRHWLTNRYHSSLSLTSSPDVDWTLNQPPIDCRQACSLGDGAADQNCSIEKHIDRPKKPL